MPLPTQARNTALTVLLSVLFCRGWAGLRNLLARALAGHGGLGHHHDAPGAPHSSATAAASASGQGFTLVGRMQAIAALRQAAGVGEGEAGVEALPGAEGGAVAVAPAGVPVLASVVAGLVGADGLAMRPRLPGLTNNAAVGGRVVVRNVRGALAAGAPWLQCLGEGFVTPGYPAGRPGCNPPTSLCLCQPRS